MVYISINLFIIAILYKKNNINNNNQIVFTINFNIE